jgi:hypothetical protein
LLVENQEREILPHVLQGLAVSLRAVDVHDYRRGFGRPAAALRPRPQWVFGPLRREGSIFPKAVIERRASIRNCPLGYRDFAKSLRRAAAPSDYT